MELSALAPAPSSLARSTTLRRILGSHAGCHGRQSPGSTLRYIGTSSSNVTAGLNGPSRNSGGDGDRFRHRIGRTNTNTRSVCLSRHFRATAPRRALRRGSFPGGGASLRRGSATCSSSSPRFGCGGLRGRSFARRRHALGNGLLRGGSLFPCGPPPRLAPAARFGGRCLLW